MKNNLNLNIFYDPNYWLKDRNLINKNLSQSKILNILYLIQYSKNKPIPENFIKSGPQKLVNNLIKACSHRNDIKFNKHSYDNYYFCNFDKVNLPTVEDIVLDKKNKLIVGPLYTNSDFLKLLDLAKNNSNLKIITASESSKKMLLEVANSEKISNLIHVLPIGIFSNSEIKKNLHKKTNLDDCLIYFKGRKKDELKKVIKILKLYNINFKIFEYGKYKKNDFIKTAKLSKFGVILGRTESQGIAINELIASNLPLIILNSTINSFDGKVYEGTTVPYWSSKCGEVTNDLNNFEDTLNYFLINLENNKYSPAMYASATLSYEAMFKNISRIFSEI